MAHVGVIICIAIAIIAAEWAIAILRGRGIMP